MKLLVELGVDPPRLTKAGCTPLMTAAGIGTLAPPEEAGTEDESIEAVKYLLAAMADVKAVDRNGETAMHGAAIRSLSAGDLSRGTASRAMMCGDRLRILHSIKSSALITGRLPGS